MAQRKLLTNGSAFKRTDGRWCGVVWYMDEYEQRKTSAAPPKRKNTPLKFYYFF